MSRPVSLVISFYNKIDELRFVLTALERQTYTNFEVVIADDGSKPEVVKEIAELKSRYFFPIQHQWHEDKGWQKNKILNNAVVASEGEYLIFIDGDCIPHPKFIQEHLENRAPGRVISGRRVLLSERVSKKLTLEKIRSGYLDRRVAIPLLFESIFLGSETHVENMLRIRNKILRKLFVKDKIRGFWGCNFSIWKKDLLKVNGFDERYVYPGFGEDRDLDDRLQRNGILPISKKHLVTEYHIYHVHFDTMHEENLLLFNEKNVNNEKYTPYGIIKDEKILEKTQKEI